MERYPCSWAGRINIVKLSILTEAVYRFNAIPPYQDSNIIFYKTRKNNPKIHMESQRPQIAKAILRKKDKGGGIMFLNFKLCYK